jgi:hypothetical protein
MAMTMMSSSMDDNPTGARGADMTTAQATLRGPLYIDLGKRKRGGIDKPDSGLDWRGYNAAPHDGPDKDAKGRWKSGHPSVRALGEMPDFAHHLSDDDLRDAKGQARSLIQAIEAEEKRRKAEAPAKPKAAVKPIPAELAERVEAIRKRPIPSDIDYLERQLPKLTVAQLEQLARQGEDWAEVPLPGGSKASKVEGTIRRLAGRLMSEAVTHQSSAKGREHYGEYRRRTKLADERGDREEYAALVAGFGIGGTGPGLPPEKPVPKKTISQAMFGDEPLMGSHAWRAQQESAAQKRERALDMLSRTPDDEGEARRIRLEAAELAASADRMEAGAKAQERAKKPLKVSARKGGATEDASVAIAAAMQSSWMDSTFGSTIDAIIAKPNSDSPATLTEMLSRLKVSQIGELAAKHDVKLLGRTKKDKIDSFVASTVQNKLNSQAIREGAATRPGERGFDVGAASPAKIRRQEDRIARLSVALDVENRKRSKTSRIQSRKESQLRHELTQAKRELAAMKGGSGQSGLERPAGGPIKPGEFGSGSGKPASPTYLDTPARTVGDGQFHGDHYHGDGNMGTAIKGMSPKQRSINIGGKRLDDALADIIIMGHSGEPGVSARQVEAFKDIAAQLGQIDSSAANAVTRAISKINPPRSFDSFEIDSAIRPGDPEPLRRLMEDIDSAAANVFEPDAELKALEKMVTDYREGQISATRMINGLGNVMRRHESQEGFFEVRNAIQRAERDLEAMRKAGTLPMRNKRAYSTEEIRDARAAVKDAKAELVRAYGADPDNWPDTRQDPQVAEYYEMRRRLAEMES